jgi:hypothetical protein
VNDSRIDAPFFSHAAVLLHSTALPADNGTIYEPLVKSSMNQMKAQAFFETAYPVRYWDFFCAIILLI